MIRRTATVAPQRALVEALLLAAALILFFAGTVLFSAGPSARVLPQGMLIVSGFTALLAALRCRVPKAGWWRQVGVEVGYAALLNTGFALVSVGLLSLLGQAALDSGAAVGAAISDLITIVAIASSGPLYLLFRAAVRVWLWWDERRRTRLLWSLTHAHLAVAVGAALVLIVVFTVGFYFFGSQNYYQVEDAGAIAQALDWVVFGLFPLVGVLTVFTIIGLLVIIPPSALFSYFVARRTTSRLKALASTTAAFRQGDYRARSPVQGEDEVAQLQADFNAMAADLERAIADLETERDTVAGLLQSRRELVASVSHDLRTPAATIRSTLESALNRWDGDPPPELKQEMGVMLGEVERLQTLVDDLFLLSRAEVGQLTLRTEAVDAREIVRQTVSAAAPLAWQSKRVEVLADLPAELPPVRADADRLAQVLHNLIHNAVRHTPPGGIVVLGGETQPGGVQLTVRDTGEGIAPEDLARVWERFYRADPESGGAGLGLSIVKELVELMGGSAAVESRPGEGSCFAVRLPRA